MPGRPSGEWSDGEEPVFTCKRTKMGMSGEHEGRISRGRKGSRSWGFERGFRDVEAEDEVLGSGGVLMSQGE